jgi:urease accessory protein
VRTLADRLAPYSCYATAILYGPAMRETLRDVSQRCEKISVFKQASPPPLLWSFSWVGPEREGGVIRVAATDTEGVRDFLKELLHDNQNFSRDRHIPQGLSITLSQHGDYSSDYLDD